jgi:hypothetical protein
MEIRPPDVTPGSCFWFATACDANMMNAGTFDVGATLASA